MKKTYASGCANWRAIPGEGMTPDAVNELIKKNKLTVKPIEDNYFAPTRLCDYITPKGNFAYLVNGEHILTLYSVEEKDLGRKGFLTDFKKYSIKLNDDDSSAATGKQAFDYINKAFEKLYGISFRVAFGYSPQLLDCIPKPLNYGRINPEPQFSFYKADVSSAYSYEATKALPTVKGSKVVPGVAKPTPDFPFAFYPNEGQLAIYGESKHLFDIPLTATYTLLCPKCQYSLKPIFDELYTKKEAATTPEEKQYYKDIMNYFVGWLHWRPKNKKTGEYAKYGEPEYNANCPRYAAVAAVIKARCNARMLDLKDEIEADRSNRVLLINTDAVGWQGEDIPELYTTQKGLGNLILEHRDAEVLILGSKKYQIKDKKEVITKWSGVRKELTSSMKWLEILTSPIKPKERMWSWEKQQIVYKED